MTSAFPGHAPSPRADAGWRAALGPGRLAAAVLAACTVLCAGSCAQKGFPPGGPPDVTPPEVVYVHPDSGAGRVAPDTRVSITFDDKVDRRSVEGALHITPPTDMESLNWDGRVVTVTPAEGLIEDRTYTVMLALGMKDRRGNESKRPVVVHFSTGDSVAPGVVKGTVETGRARAPSVMVWAYLAGDCPPQLGATRPEGVGQAGPQGEFFIGALDTRETYCIYGHLDRDGDDELDDEDLFMGADSTVAFVPDSSVVAGVVIYLVPDDEPGEIAGAVVDSAGPDLADLEAVVLPRNMTAAAAPAADSTPGPAPVDTVQIAPLAGDTGIAPVDTVALKRVIADSIYSAAKIIVLAIDVADSANFAQAELAKPGAFSLKGLSPGEYLLEAFRDLDGDKAATPGREPVARRAGIAVKPGRTADIGTLVLRRESTKVEGE